MAYLKVVLSGIYTTLSDFYRRSDCYEVVQDELFENTYLTIATRKHEIKPN